MADSELGELRRSPRPVEARIARIGGWKSQGLAGGTSDTPYPLDYGDSLTLGPNGDGGTGEPTPDWFAESLTLTTASGSTASLTYEPVDFSTVIRLNGITLVEGVDYTVAGRVVTFLDRTDLLRGIGSDSWTLAATYPYYDSAVEAEPTLGYVTYDGLGGASSGHIDLQQPVIAGDVAILALQGSGATPSGGFATWTLLRSGSGDSGHVAVWLGTGIGTGFIDSDSYMVVAVYRDVTGTVTVTDTQAFYAADSLSSTLSAPAATAAVGNIVFSAVRGMHGFLDRYHPDGTHTDTGFTGTLAYHSLPGAAGEGTALCTGIATATSVDCVFGMTNDTGTGRGEAVNLVLTVT